MYKILVFGMTENPGGVESVIMNYYHYMDKNTFHFDFLCNSYNKIAFEEEIISNGSQTFHFPARSKNYKKYKKELKNFFENNASKYDAICLIEGRENKTRLGKIKAHYDVYMLWKNALKKIKKNDWIYIQFPLLEHTMLFSLLIKNLEKRGIHTSIIIHDVEAIRFTLRNDVPLSRKIRMRFEEISSFKNCSKIIVHNEKMKSFMHEKWKIHKDKMDILGIFDYLVENYNEELLEKRNLSRKGPVIIAGALSKHKAGYIYNLPENCNFNLYGINFEREKASSNTNYVGAFNPEELIYNLQGSFGLVWDGDSSATCTGVYGDYLKINNPHKGSLCIFYI